LERAEIALNAQDATRNALNGWQDANQSIGHLLLEQRGAVERIPLRDRGGEIQAGGAIMTTKKDGCSNSARRARLELAAAAAIIF